MEFQAVVMAAGKGSRMMELTAESPKCLLPVGNLPLIRSCLTNLKKLRVKSCIVLVSEQDKSKIQDAIESKCDFKVDVVGIPSNEDWGTADSLRHIHDKINSDILIVSCDMVTNFNILKMANFHRTYNSSFTMLLIPVSKSSKEAAVPGHKGKNKLEKDIIGIDKSGRLVFYNSEADLEEGLPMIPRVLERCPEFNVYSNLVDAHLYMLKKSLVDYIISNNKLSAIKGEFLPVIVSKQFSKNPLSLSGDNDKIVDGNIDMFSDLKTLAYQLSSFDTEEKDSGSGNPLLKCYAYVEKESFCVRVNTLVAFMEANRQISKNVDTGLGIVRKPSTFPKSQVDNDSIVGEDCQLLLKSSVKQSVVGNCCNFGEKSKISGSVVMDNVMVDSGSTISGCIICNNVSIGSNCELKNCVVSPDQSINAGTKLLNEVVQRNYEFMDI